MDVISREVWNSMLTAEFSVKYWERLANRYDDRLKWVAIILAIVTSGAFVSLISPLQLSVLPKVISFISAAFAIISTQLKWKDLLAEISSVRGMCIEIAAAHQQLWRDIRSGTITSETARKRLDKIREKEVSATKSRPNIRDDTKLKQECFEEILTSRGLKKNPVTNEPN